MAQHSISALPGYRITAIAVRRITDSITSVFWMNRICTLPHCRFCGVTHFSFAALTVYRSCGLPVHRLTVGAVLLFYCFPPLRLTVFASLLYNALPHSLNEKHNRPVFLSYCRSESNQLILVLNCANSFNAIFRIDL